MGDCTHGEGRGSFSCLHIDIHGNIINDSVVRPREVKSRFLLNTIRLTQIKHRYSQKNESGYACLCSVGRGIRRAECFFKKTEMTSVVFLPQECEIESLQICR